MSLREVVGIVFIIVGVVLGLYVGIWVCFIGGIIDLMEVVQQEDQITASTIAIGVLKIMFASFCGSIAAAIPILVGIFIVSK
tara:strand:- start:516 stop:761 length:246 start_codon:yes stop_codon:yes gene_type:complete